MKFIHKLVRRGAILALLFSLAGIIAISATYFYLAPQLPSVDALKDIRFQVPLQVYSQDNQLIAEYGSKKRDPLRYEQIPTTMINAILASEDDRFFEHPGVDYQGILRAVAKLITTGEKAQGGSTITMQVARNFFLSREKTYLRKINEIFLSFKIENELSKEQILELYLNKIYLGNRSYGIGSAAMIYYGKPLQELSLAQYAMLAGLPKAPSSYNPIANAERALIRRNYVLKRMLTLGKISQAEHDNAKAEAVSAKLNKQHIDLEAPYIGEMVRSYMYDLHGEEAYTNGYKVFVTIDPELQLAAQNALRQNLLSYEYRHGFRGPVEHIEIGPETDSNTVLKHLKTLPTVGHLKPAIIIHSEEQTSQAILANGEQIELTWEGLSWAAPYLDTNHKGKPPTLAEQIITSGDIIYVLQNDNDEWQLGQIPNVSGAIIALNPKDGSLMALSGGFDFFYTKFNRAIQAKRQAGSSFKPFIYSAALEKGFTTASIINDAPVVFDDPSLETSWRPENYSGRIYGPTRLREAITRSRNLVSIRLLQAIGIPYAIEYAQRFGFKAKQLPRDLSLSLGSASVTPMDIASAYTIFANGGFRVSSYFIQRIEDIKGNIIFEAEPAIACLPCEQAARVNSENDVELRIDDQTETTINETLDTTSFDTLEPAPQPKLAERIISSQNAYLMTSMMRDVITRGTARKALQLGRKDLAGKTGTTNDQRDAWFSGFNSEIVAISWTGFDDGTPLGNKETGGRASLPLWIDFMGTALKDRPEIPLEQPEGLITVRIDPETGLLAAPRQKNAIFETFRNEYAPQRRAADIDDSVSIPDSNNNGETAPQLLF